MSKVCFNCDGDGWERLPDGYGDTGNFECFYCDGKGCTNEHKDDDTNNGNEDQRSDRKVCSTCLSGSLQ